MKTYSTSLGVNEKQITSIKVWYHNQLEWINIFKNLKIKNAGEESLIILVQMQTASDILKNNFSLSYNVKPLLII